MLRFEKGDLPCNKNNIMSNNDGSKVRSRFFTVSIGKLIYTSVCPEVLKSDSYGL